MLVSCSHLERSGNEDQTIRCQILHASSIYAHKVDDIASCSLSVVAEHQCLFVDGRYETRTYPHTREEAEVEVLEEKRC